ncbi:MAG: trypsin-like peptidase domain-containing protein [Acidobacteriota bacterium]
METPSSELSKTLQALSNDLADTVARISQAVVAVHGRHRIPSSGVHWQPGVIVTAEHTVKREEDIFVTLPDNRTLPAQLAGRDASTDLAVLKLTGVELPVAEIGDSQALKVGHLMLAVGRAGENGATASLGVISALSGSWRTWSGGKIDQFVRLDMTSYPGFSGSALVNAQGQIVGINTFGPRSMVLALPASTVKRIVTQLLEKGRIARGYLGLGLQAVQLPDSLVTKLNLSGRGGVIVVTVKSSGPAEKAGVLIGDILIDIDGKLVNDTNDIQSALEPGQVGKALKTKIVRGGNLLELEIIVGELPRRDD